MARGVGSAVARDGEDLPSMAEMKEPGRDEGTAEDPLGVETAGWFHIRRL